MSQTQPLPPKKEVALALLERSSVYVHLDPRQTPVVVPPWLKKQPQLVLQVGLHMNVPIPDLRVDEDGISCTLSFNRTPFYCVVPWSSVFAMIDDDGRGMVWPDDVPSEVARQAQGRTGEAAGAPEVLKAEAPGEEPKREVAKPKRPRKRLAAVAEGAEVTPEAGPSAEAAAPTPAPVEAPVRPVAAPAAARPAEAPAPRRKRELPPYLRIVK
jgi:hypothetical protein